MKSKRTKATSFNETEKMKIIKRDKGRCIFCEMGECKEKADPFELKIKDIMHYIPRSRGGLGIEHNGAVGCRYHHHLLDNGNQGKRKEMMEKFEKYLKGKYDNWDDIDKIYNKYI